LQEESHCRWNRTARSRLHGEQRECLPMPAFAHRKSVTGKKEHTWWNKYLVLMALGETVHQKVRLLGCLETLLLLMHGFPWAIVKDGLRSHRWHRHRHMGEQVAWKITNFTWSWATCSSWPWFWAGGAGL